jgi:hypothetical protein
MKHKKTHIIESSDGLVLNVINQIIEMFPEFQNKKKTIINKLTNINNIEKPIYSEIIFDKIIINDTVYYKDKINYIWNVSAKIIGIYIDNNTYYLFDDIIKLKNEIIETYYKIQLYKI